MKTFNNIHMLMKKRRYARALALLLDNKRNKINRAYASNDSDKNHSWYIVGDILYKKKKYQKAIYAFRKAVLAWKKDGEALWAIGNCYSELGYPALAERFFRKGLVHVNKSYRSNLIYNIGNALFDQDRYAEAVKQYKRIPSKEKRIYKLAQKNIKKCKARIEKKPKP